MSPLRVVVAVFLLIGGLAALNALAPIYFDRMDSNIEYGSSLSDRLHRLELDNDVIFLGDSRTHQGMSPPVFVQAVEALGGPKVKALNLARPGMQTPFMYYTLQNYLEHADRPPNAIIVNVSYYLLYGREWMERIYLRGFVPTRAQAVDAVRSGLLSPWQGISWYACPRIALCKYRATLHNVVVPTITGLDDSVPARLVAHARIEKTAYDAADRGYLSRGDSFIDASETWPNREAFAGGRHDSVFVDYFRRFVQLASDNGIQVLVYEFPWPPAHHTEQDQANIAHYRDLLMRIAASNVNLQFVHYDHFWPHELFVDPLHVNNAGAEKLSQKAAEWHVLLSTNGRR